MTIEAPTVTTAEAIEQALCSSRPDANGKYANVVDVLDNCAQALWALRNAILPGSAMAGEDASGGHVDSLTEAVMGITGGLYAIAEAGEHIAEEIEYLATLGKPPYPVALPPRE